MARFDIFGKLAKPFRKSVEPLIRRTSEGEIIAAVIERLPIEGEAPLQDGADRVMTKEDEFRRLVRRLEPQLEALGITTDEMLRYYDRPLNAILLLKFTETYKKKPSQAIKDRLTGLGFLYLQNNVWVLPPSRTPQQMRTQEDIKVWLRQTITKSLRKDYQFVMPFVALVDMKKVVAEKHRVVKLPAGRTIFSIMDRRDLLPASYIFDYMKRKGFSLEGMIRGGDVVFLASAFADQKTLEVLKKNREQITGRIRQLMGTDGLSLSYLADLHERELASALKDYLPHPMEAAKRLGVEAKYWERFLGGEIESRGPEKPSAPAGQPYGG